MIERGTLEDAIDLALQVHAGKRDKGGEPYILHPIRVMLQQPTPQARIVAVLHDVVEDGNISCDDLLARGFDPRVVRAVDAVTRRGGEPYEHYVMRAACDPIGRLVKLADLQDNMDVRRLASFGDEDVERLRRYDRAWRMLRAVDDPERAEAERYDEDYAKVSSVFGESPDALLTRFADLIDRNRPVLDVGAGQGRHTLYLAELGLVVDAIDPSEVGIEQTRERARQRGVVVQASVAGWETFDGRTAHYGAVLLFGVVQLMARDRIKSLARRAFQWLAPGGLLFVTGHTTDDAGHAKRESDPAWLRLEPGTFVGPIGQVRTYLSPGEVVGLFPGFEVVHHEEAVGPEHRHGDGPIERHAIVHALFRKRGS